jgi:outer membrane protein OmpA-like peptidoglycan-associated protein/tetratricopeptide (TPR) repeat protein
MKYLALLLSFILIPSVLDAQHRLTVRKKDFKIVETGLHDAWKSIREGNKYFDQGFGTYRDARNCYLKAYRYNPNCAALNYNIGLCYLFSDEKYEAIKYLTKTIQSNPSVAPDIKYLLGRAYHLTLEFDKAISYYSDFLNQIGPDKWASGTIGRVNRLIEQCRNGKDLVAKPQRVVITDLGKAVNSVEDDYNPVLSYDEKTMYFTSRRTGSEKDRRNPFDNKFYEDIYFTRYEGGHWTDAQKMESPPNSKKNTTNNSAVSLSANGKKMFLYTGHRNAGDILTSEKQADLWSRPKPLKGKVNSKSRETSLCITKDGGTMYFISDNKAATLGGTDIFKSELMPDGKWSKPANMGNLLNSAYDEAAVRLSGNDSVLYFSSKGHKTMGGYDIFRSELLPGGVWSPPENIGYPINTPDDDLFYFPSSLTSSAYYSTILEKGIGGKDIYKVVFLGAEKEIIFPRATMLISGLMPPAENIFYTLPVKFVVDTSLLMKGTITDSETRKPVFAKMDIIDTEFSRVVATTTSDTSGRYFIRIPLPKRYGIEIVARNYMLNLDVVDLTQESYRHEIIRDFMLEPIEIGARMILKNIFFEFGKSTLKPESYIQLDNVVLLLKSTPGLRIEISGHTDNVGSAKANQKLSEERSKAVVDYLVSRGIELNRLEYKGYGFSQPVASNSTPEGRSQNRRVEFKIIGK